MSGLALCLVLGLGCSSDGLGSDAEGSGGSGGQGSGTSTASDGGSSGSGSAGAGGSGGVKGSDSSETGGKTESSSSQAGGKAGSGGGQAGGKAGSGGGQAGGKAGSGGGQAGGKAGNSGSTSGETGGNSSGGSTGGRGGTSGRAGSTGSGGDTGGGTSTGNVDGKSPGCGKTSTITEFNKGNPIPIAAGGKNRRYVLQVPTNYDKNKPYTFMLALHARDSNDKTMHDWQYYGLLPLSNNTVIFAAPNGEKNGTPCSGTSSGDSGCGWPNGNIPLMDAVVKEVTENFCVDMNHIYATGWSYGASMSYEIACQRPLGGTSANWGVRAIAIYSGAQLSGSCKPSTSNPVAFYESHGTNDNVLGYDGGVNLAKNWATANGCSAFNPARTSGAHVCTAATGCKQGYDTIFCSFNGGHTPYPDSGSDKNSWGPAEVWKFFQKF